MHEMTAVSLMTQSMRRMNRLTVERQKMVMTMMKCSFLDRPVKTNGNQDAEPVSRLLWKSIVFCWTNTFCLLLLLFHL